MLFKPITSISYHETNNWLSCTPSLQTIFKSFPTYTELHDSLPHTQVCSIVSSNGRKPEQEVCHTTQQTTDM